MQLQLSPQAVSFLQSPNTKAVFAQVDWGKLIPAIIDLVRLLSEGDLLNNWERILQIVQEIIKALIQAEQQAGVQFDWQSLIELILTLLPILLG